MHILRMRLKTLETLSLYNKNLTVVFGWRDRDISKRSKMALIAKKYCKKIYVTDDNRGMKIQKLSDAKLQVSF